MKTILILTDFSENALCAAETGLALSGKLHTDLLLFNTYIDYAALPYEAGGGWDIHGYSRREHRSLQQLDAQLEGLESLAAEIGAADRKPSIYVRSANSDLGTQVAEILGENDIELVVMGARAHLPDDPLPGYDTGAVIKNADCPILVVPAKTDPANIRKILFATDFDEAGFNAIRYLMKLGRLFNYQIEVVHVNKPGERRVNPKATSFKQRISSLEYQGLSYQEVKGKDLITRINRELNENGPAILAMLHHQLPFFSRLFTRSKTKAALARLRAPLLIFPAGVKGKGPLKVIKNPE